VSQRDSGPSGPDDLGPAPQTEPESAREPQSVVETPPDRIVSINRATLRGVDFRKARFDKFELAGCLFVACDFRAVRFDKRLQPLFLAAPQSIFRDCRFDGADLRHVRSGQARFERCTFDDAAIDAFVANFQAPGNLAGGFAHYRAVAAQRRAEASDDPPPPQPPIPLPTCVRWAQCDPTLPAEWSDRLAETFPNLDFAPFPDAGHFPHREQPDRASAEIGTFFERLSAPDWQA